MAKAKAKALIGIPPGVPVTVGGIEVEFIGPAIGKVDFAAVFGAGDEGPQDGDQEPMGDAPSEGVCSVPGCDTCATADTKYAPQTNTPPKLTADDFFAARAAGEAPTGTLGAAGFGGRPLLNYALRSLLLARLHAAAPAANPDSLSLALDYVEETSDRPLLDWLKAGGLQEIIQAVLAVLKLFA